MQIENIITQVSIVVVAIFGSTGFWAWLSNRQRTKSSETKLLLGLAYSEIIKRCEWAILKGEIAADSYNELDRYLFQPYKDCGGNGTAEKLMNEVKRLPHKAGGDNE